MKIAYHIIFHLATNIEDGEKVAQKWITWFLHARDGDRYQENSSHARLSLSVSYLKYIEGESSVPPHPSDREIPVICSVCGWNVLAQLQSIVDISVYNHRSLHMGKKNFSTSSKVGRRGLFLTGLLHNWAIQNPKQISLEGKIFTRNRWHWFKKTKQNSISHHTPSPFLIKSWLYKQEEEVWLPTFCGTCLSFSTLTKTERITFLWLLRVYTSWATSDRHHQTVKHQIFFGFFFLFFF